MAGKSKLDGRAKRGGDKRSGAESKARPKSKLRRFMTWVGLPAALLAGLFTCGVHVGARNPGGWLTRAIYRVVGEEPPSRYTWTRDTPELDGRWRIKDFEVAIVAPRGLRLHSYTRAFGLLMHLNTPKEEFDAPSEVQVSTSCAGTCKPETYEDRVANEIAQKRFESISTTKHRPEWVERPHETRDGTWRARIRSYDGDELVMDEGWVWHIIPGAEQFQRCAFTLRRHHTARGDEMMEFCRTLPWQAVPPERKDEPIEARFGGVYTIGGAKLSVPPPEGFSFESFDLGKMVTFRHRAFQTSLDMLSVAKACEGRCDADELPANLAAVQARRAAKAKQDGFVTTGAVEVAPGRWTERMRKRDGVHGYVSALVPGRDNYWDCSYTLSGDNVERADELEQLCLEVFAGLE